MNYILNFGNVVRLTRMLAFAGSLITVMPVGAAPMKWQCSIPGTEKTILLTLDEETAQVAWDIGTTEKRWTFTETAIFSSDLIQWPFELPSTDVTMHHQFDRESGELMITQGDTGKRTFWYCTSAAGVAR